jgi:hypothetical protein
MNLLNENKDLGLDLKSGDSHYRAYVGPPEDYDLAGAMCFNLLTAIGLRQHHTLLDVGCGSLRAGRFLMPYLNEANYIGVEPNGWLIEDGIKREIGQDLINIKKPQFIVSDSLKGSNIKNIDFALAQSVFSHAGKPIIINWLKEIHEALSESGCLFASVLLSESVLLKEGSPEESQEEGWVYPGCLYFKLSTFEELAHRAGFELIPLNFWHPRLSWLAFVKKDFDTSLLKHESIQWNNLSSKYTTHQFSR